VSDVINIINSQLQWKSARLFRNVIVAVLQVVVGT